MSDDARHHDRRLALPASGASAGTRDFAATLVRGSGRFLVWFCVGGLGADWGPPRRRFAMFALLRVLVVLTLVFLTSWGLANPIVATVLISTLLAGGLAAFIARAKARAALYDVATRELGSFEALSSSNVTAPKLLPARPLQELALAVDRIRRGDARGAHDALSNLDVEQLHTDERRMVEAVRALVARSWSDTKTAMVCALNAFPTGALDIDERIAQISVEGTWHDGVRLSRMADDWARHGITESDTTNLGKLLRFTLVKLARVDPCALPGDERRELAELARILGDFETAALARATPSSRAPGYR
ncbi:MAG: hypothetical protein HOW73_34205 [Polyangiaceae bacterium]|nr:hypothetical protein [Polyangiaceae bacterium]